MKKSKKQLLNNESCIKSKLIGFNTIEIIQEDCRVIRYHETDIITEYPDKIILNSGGWKTKTTKDRMNLYTNLDINQKNNSWFVNGHLFYDNITFDKQGNLLSEVKESNVSKVNKIKKQITEYINLLNEDNLPEKSGGDCWYCLLNFSEDTEHLKSHLEEKYIHGAILVNSMLEYGYRPEQIPFHYYLKNIDSFKRALRKYLQKRLLKDIL